MNSTSPSLKIERKLGLTSVLKQAAFYYLTKGLGSHASIIADFDEVIVRKLYDFHSPQGTLPAQGGIVVEFHYMGEKKRWVEFGCHVIGGGGEPIIKEV